MGIRIERLVDYYFFLLVKFSIKSAPSLFQKKTVMHLQESEKPTNEPDMQTTAHGDQKINKR